MIHKALKVIRQFHEIKQVELAAQLGISKSYLCEIEAGKKPVSLELLEKYSDIYDIPVSSLIFFSESMDNEGKIQKKFRNVFAGKVIKIMEWLIERNGSRKIKA